jgi:hypothetical protein
MELVFDCDVNQQNFIRAMEKQQHILPMHILGHSWGDGMRLMNHQQYRHSVESRWLVVYRGLVENRVAMVTMM